MAQPASAASNGSEGNPTLQAAESTAEMVQPASAASNGSDGNLTLQAAESTSEMAQSASVVSIGSAGNRPTLQPEEDRRLVYVSAETHRAWWKKSDVPNGIDIMPCELDQKPLQLQNHHLPVVFAGGPRSQRVIPVYSTTIYDFTGKVRELPEEMLQKLDEDLLQARAQAPKMDHFPYKELILNLEPRSRDAQWWFRDSGTRGRDSPEKHVYVRFFSKGSLVETLMMKALVPAMMHAVDVYNSFTFFVQAKCLRFTFLAAFLCLYFLTWLFAKALAEEEMKEDFKVTVRDGQIVGYDKNELGVKPKRNAENQPCNEQENDGHYKKMLTLLSLSFVLTTPRSLVELILHLHCRGDHPGKAASKVLGTRQLLATWMSKEHFEIVDQRGFECIVPAVLLTKVVLFMIQFAIWCLTQDHKLWIQMGFKLFTIGTLIYQLCWIWQYQKSLFKTATARWFTYLADQLKARVNQVNRAQLRTLHEDDLEELPIPRQIPFRPDVTETQEQFQQRIRETLQGNVIHTIEMPEGQEGKFPAYLNKLWLHVLKKHFPHCLGKNFCYKHCWLSVHWPIPKFEEDVQRRLRKLAGFALGILCICIFVDCLLILPRAHQAQQAAVNAQLQQAVADASHFLAPNKLLS